MARAPAEEYQRHNRLAKRLNDDQFDGDEQTINSEDKAAPRLLALPAPTLR